MFFSHRERGLHEGEVGVVGNHSLREGRELNVLFTQLVNLLYDHSTVPCRLYSTGLICTAAALTMVFTELSFRADIVEFRPIRTRRRLTEPRPRILFAALTLMRKTLSYVEHRVARIVIAH